MHPGTDTTTQQDTDMPQCTFRRDRERRRKQVQRRVHIHSANWKRSMVLFYLDPKDWMNNHDKHRYDTLMTRLQSRPSASMRSSHSGGHQGRHQSSEKNIAHVTQNNYKDSHGDRPSQRTASPNRLAQVTREKAACSATAVCPCSSRNPERRGHSCITAAARCTSRHVCPTSSEGSARQGPQP